ncbi:hypothetical protein PUN28_018009 [Cardiocondyla obscurior]|uniref:Uncharacterized protein n=1 Tax=Cardiocondyla obscurior TaxID=286306 RepID=A0AAW2EHP1_9HYME
MITVFTCFTVLAIYAYFAEFPETSHVIVLQTLIALAYMTMFLPCHMLFSKFTSAYIIPEQMKRTSFMSGSFNKYEFIEFSTLLKRKFPPINSTTFRLSINIVFIHTGLK